MSVSIFRYIFPWPVHSTTDANCKLIADGHSGWNRSISNTYVFIGNSIPTTCSMFNFIDFVATIVLFTKYMVTGGSVFSVRIEFTPYADCIRCHCRLAIAVCCPTPNHALQRRMCECVNCCMAAVERKEGRESPPFHKHTNRHSLIPLKRSKLTTTNG